MNRSKEFIKDKGYSFTIFRRNLLLGVWLILMFVGCREPQPCDRSLTGSVEHQTSTSKNQEGVQDVSVRSNSENEKVSTTSTRSGYILSDLHKIGILGQSTKVCTSIEEDVPEAEPLIETIVPDIKIASIPNERYSSQEDNPRSFEHVQLEHSISCDEISSMNTVIHERSIEVFSQNADECTSDVPKTVKLILELAKEKTYSPPAAVDSNSIQFRNGNDILDLSLPEALTLGQLLELTGKHLHLDYVYSPQTISNQSVALKLHGGLNGEMRIKDLYVLLETVLKFNGLAMIRREHKLVTIVPVAEALGADPQLVDGANQTVHAGDTVLTRVFKLQYVDAASVTTLLQNMKLGVAVSTSEEARILFVTCYAHRMGRIEQMVNMIDRPGRARECRFRRLQFTTAPVLAQKVRTLAQEIQGIPITMASKTSKGPESTKNVGFGQSVYLDTDERTNRLVMIGHEEQLGFLEELVDALDMNQGDLHISKIYNIKHITAREALRKLQEIDMAGSSTNVAGKPHAGTSRKTSPIGAELTEKPAVVVLEATNQLLIKATRPQHAHIEEFLGYIDISPEDLCILRVYEIKYIDAVQVRTKLEELNAAGIGSAASPRPAMAVGTAKTGKGRTSIENEVGTAKAFAREPQIVVNESTNSLLVKATANQHARIKKIIDYVDCTMPEEELSYKIYPLENSSPVHVANILEKLIHETTPDKDGKAALIVKREKITIVPDPNTFSLIVYASRKNQEWIGTLTKSLDRRRPQVLIDVTLVEITRTDTFEYDLNLVANAKDAVIGNIGIDPIHRINSKARIEGAFNMMDSEGNPTGQTRAFYSDKKIQTLLTAMKRKNYGRVLAKPKILVDDGQQGEISTTDETTYVKEAIQIPEDGTPITTRDYEAVTASIQLQITPHIGEGDLLRLDVHLSRDDFGTRPQEGAPPDKATSQVTTTVFVPDTHTVILGGLVKLNQSKGGSKVPILGDIPLIGILFRSVDNSDIEKKLYVFLKANIVRPFTENQLEDLQQISQKHRKAFEKSETEFQDHQHIPGIKPQPMKPERVLNEL